MENLQGITERPLQPHEQREEYMTLGVTALTSMSFMTSVILLGVIPDRPLIVIISIAVFFLLAVFNIMLNVHYSKTVPPPKRSTDTMQQTLLPGTIPPVE